MGLDFFLVNYLTISDDLCSNHRVCWSLDFESFRCRNGDETPPPEKGQQKTPENQQQKRVCCLKIRAYEGNGQGMDYGDDPENDRSGTTCEKDKGKDVNRFLRHRIKGFRDLRCCYRMLPERLPMISQELSGECYESPVFLEFPGILPPNTRHGYRKGQQRECKIQNH